MNNTTYEDINKKDEYTFSDLYLALARGIKWIILTPLVIGILTIIYLLFFSKPIYESTATIFPSFGESGNNSNLLSMASNFGISLPSQFKETDILSADMYPAIIKSRTLAKTVLGKSK